MICFRWGSLFLYYLTAHMGHDEVSLETKHGAELRCELVYETIRP